MGSDCSGRRSRVALFLLRALPAIPVLGAVLAPSASTGAEAVGPGATCRWRVVRDVQGSELWAAAALADSDRCAVGDNGLHGAVRHSDGRSRRRVGYRLRAFGIDA